MNFALRPRGTTPTTTVMQRASRMMLSRSFPRSSISGNLAVMPMLRQSRTITAAAVARRGSQHCYCTKSPLHQKTGSSERGVCSFSSVMARCNNGDCNNNSSHSSLLRRHPVATLTHNNNNKCEEDHAAAEGTDDGPMLLLHHHHSSSSSSSSVIATTTCANNVDILSSEALEIMEAQREWDNHLDDPAWTIMILGDGSSSSTRNNNISEERMDADHHQPNNKEMSEQNWEEEISLGTEAVMEDLDSLKIKRM